MFLKRLPLVCLLFLLTGLYSCQKPKDITFTGFENFQLEPLSFASSKISFGVGIFNPNEFDIKVKYLQADIQLSGSSLGSYQKDSLFIIPRNQAFVLPVELTVKNSLLLGNALGMLTGDSVNYSLVGKVKAGKKIMTEIPFTYSGHLSQKDFMR